MRTVTSILAMLSGVLLAAAHAQNAGDNMSNSAGSQIASNGAPGGVTACASCHGAKGEGNAAGGFPRIAGQPQAYLARQLASYANGSRNNPVMAPIAKALKPQQIDAVTAYYATLTAPPSKPPAQAAPQVQQRGQALATTGDAKLGVQGCANCHGPGGIGEAPAYPYLAGQHASYLKTALEEWKSGARNTDPSMQMSMIAKRLSDSDIAALIAYYASQPAPGPQPANVAAGSASRPAAAPPARAGTTPVPGTGTEQGAATSGGGQGAGGGGAASGSGPSGTPKEDSR